VPDAQPLLFRVPDPDRRWAAVRLCTDVPLPERELERRDGEWVLRTPPLRLHRLEYELEVEHPDGGVECIADPGHDTRAPGAFGEKSVLEAPSYRPPAWLDAPRIDAAVAEVPLGTAMRRQVVAAVWEPADSDPGRPLPLLLAHDGPEYDHLARLTDWAGAMVAAGRLPPFRLALLPPGNRNTWYGASEGYAKAMRERLVPALAAARAVDGPVAAMGASLGALAWLHVHRRFGDLLGGLFLQSGSFFTLEDDQHEAGFPAFGRITAFVRGVHRTRHWSRPIAAALTCGAEEENLANNRRMAAALERQGYATAFAENADMHNYTGWRDTFDPHLTELLARLWG
jgi:enterochelin esterase family protein